MQKSVLFIFLLFLVFSCTKDETSTQVELNNSILYIDLIQGISTNVLEFTTEFPDADGALGRNKNGYFHARFQLGISELLDYAIVFNSSSSVKQFLKSLEYCFLHQEQEGGFELIVPEEYLTNPEFEYPSKADLVSANAFIAYSLGISIINSYNLASVLSNQDYQIFNECINSYNSKLELLLDYLIVNKSLLLNNDENAPNRLLFNAVAFYSLGDFLNSEIAKNTAIEFLNNALSQRDENAGYFIEGGGWDSSYNGVALKLAMEMYVLMNDNENLKKELENAIIGAVEWQKSRVLNTGEISTEGNTRVYPGGESFIGTEKEVDVEKTLRAFYYMANLSGDKSYKQLADNIYGYYKNKKGK